MPNKYKRKAAWYSSQNVLSGLSVCAECGAKYQRITRPYEDVVWCCDNRVEHGNRNCKHSSSLSKAQFKDALCKLLGMDSFNELKVAKSIESILIQVNGTFEISTRNRNFLRL